MKEQLLKLYRANPFQPFSIKVTDGNEYLVKHPECLAFSKHYVVFTDPNDDVAEIIYLLHMAGFQVQPTVDA